MKYIDQQEVFRTTEGGKQVFQYYFPDYPFGDKKAFISIRSEDKTPSTRITQYQNLWRITDFGNQNEVNGLNAVQFVMWKENMVFTDALQFIEEVIINRKTTGSNFRRPKYQADYSYREMQSNDKTGQYRFIYKDKPSKSDLAAIGRYVDADLLNRFNCKAVKSYEYCSRSKKLNRDVVHIFSSTDDYPIFVFDYGTFKKIYKPKELKKQHRFVYVGDKPKDYIYGLSQIKEADNEFVDTGTAEYTPPEHKPEAIVKDIFRCSGESDALNLASLGFHVYWLNSETSNMTHAQWKTVDDLCLNHYQIMDMDDTGTKAAMKLALQHINLKTIYLPKWLNEKRDWRGNRCKDLKDFINISGEDLNETFQNFTVLKRKAMPMKFWEKSIAKKTGKVSYSLNLEYYYHFLKANGYYVMDSIYHRKAGYCYAKVNGKIIDLIHPDEIKKVVKRFTKEWVRNKNLSDEIDILNKINSSTQIGEANLQDLAKLEPTFSNCTKHDEYIHFNNGSLHITKENINIIKHDELPNSILGRIEINNNEISHIIKRNIRLLKQPIVEVNTTKEYQTLLDKLKTAKSPQERELFHIEIAKFPETDKYTIQINDKDFIFINFLKDLANIHWRKETEKGLPLTDEEKKEQDLTLINLLFVLGWNIAEYKDPGRPWLVFLQDMKISQVGKSSGRSGKSLYSSAIEYVRPNFYIAGRQKDITNKTDFIYDGFTIFHNNIVIDDLYEYADFNFFYTQITGKREVNSKFISKQILDYKDSGKMLISSNFELQNTDSSTLARILNAGVSDYYHEKTKYNDYLESRSPLSKYGKSLYDDFTDEEWNKFYNLMAYCIQLQQRFFKIQPPMANLEKRQLRREMTKGVGKEEEFWIWANSYFVKAPNDYYDEFSPESSQFAYFNRYVIKEDAYNAFIATLTPALASKYRKTQFKSSLKAFCEYYGFDLNPVELCGTNSANIEGRRIVKTIHGKSIEVLFISTTDTPVVVEQKVTYPPTPEKEPF